MTTCLLLALISFFFWGGDQNASSAYVSVLYFSLEKGDRMYLSIGGINVMFYDLDINAFVLPFHPPVTHSLTHSPPAC